MKNFFSLHCCGLETQEWARMKTTFHSWRWIQLTFSYHAALKMHLTSLVPFFFCPPCPTKPHAHNFVVLSNNFFVSFLLGYFFISALFVLGNDAIGLEREARGFEWGKRMQNCYQNANFRMIIEKLEEFFNETRRWANIVKPKMIYF